MINKIISISNLGKFKNYNAVGDTEFRNLNLIYADNGLGKTTLTNIFRSFKENDPDILIGRRTLGQSNPVEVKMRVGSQNAAFVSATWNLKSEKIEIFDSRFVQENIYVGSYVDIENKRALYKFVLGEEGVSLANRLDQLDDEVRRLGTEITAGEKELKARLRSDIKLEEFIDLQSPDVEKTKIEIEKIDADIKASKESANIRQKPELRSLNIAFPDQNDIIDFVKTKISDLTGDALEKVQQRMNLLGNGSARWLSHGTLHIENEKCPFCEADVDKNFLVQSFKRYFSDQFSRIQTDAVRMKSTFASTLIHDKASIHQQNILSTDYWKTYLDISFPKVEDYLAINEELKVVLKLAFDLIELKEKELDKDLSSITQTANLNEAIKRLNELLLIYESKIGDVNAEIQKFKKGLGEVNSISLEKQKAVLVDHIQRSHPDAQRKIEVILEVRGKKKHVETEKFELRKKLDTYTAEVFPKYQSLINDFLNKFGSTFTITEKTSRHSGGKPGTSYKIMINNESFDVGDSSTSQKVPSFKNTLSEGEKSTLAFCYFLAKLSLDKDLGNKIIIIDDPLSSFDSHRRHITKQEIIRLTSKAKQIVILSHDQYFLKLIWDDVNAPTRSLHIHRSTAGSILAEWNIEEETSSSYIKDFSKLYKFMESGAATDSERRDIARAIRPVLEHNLKVRCPKAFNIPGKWLGDFLGIINAADTSLPEGQLKSQYSDLNDINSYTKRYSHENSDKEPISDSELALNVKKTIKVVAGIVTSNIAHG